MNERQNHFTINVSVANLYGDPNFQSPMVTQGLLGESCEILDETETWIKVRQWDGYESWSHHFYGVKNGGDYTPSHTCFDLSGMVYENIALTLPIRDLTFGSGLHARKMDDSDGFSVVLPDGSKGYVHGDLLTGPMETTRDQIVLIARRFLGSPYVWGGKSPRGFDCSGFVQTVFRSVGIELPRDAHQQADYFSNHKIDQEDAQLGDLHFFGSGKEITHVAICLNGKNFIHSRGFVKEESMDHQAPNANPELADILVFTASVKKELAS